MSAASSPRLGHYLPCSAEHIESVLAQDLLQFEASPRRRLGQALLDRELISNEQLDAGIRAQRLDRLARCSLFDGFDENELSSLCGAFLEVTAESGEVIITQGNVDTHLFVLASGALEVYRVDEDGDELVVATVEAGEPVGEIGYVTGARRSASVRAVGRCELLRADYDALRRSFDALPRLAPAFLDVVTRRLLHTTGRFEREHQRLRRVERSLDRLGEFLDLSEVGALGAGIERLLDRLVSTASAITDADRATLFLLDSKTGELWSKVAQGDEIREIRVPAGEGVAGWVAEQRELVNIEDAYEDRRFRQDVDRRSGYRTRSMLCAPIWSLSGETLGVVQVVNKRSGTFTAEDEAFVRAFAHQAAIAVENFYLYGSMVESHRKMAVLLELASSINETLDLPTLIHRIVARTTDAVECERSSFFIVDDKAGELFSMEFQGSEETEVRFSLSTGIAGYAASTGEVISVVDAYHDPRFNPEVDRRTGYRTRSILCVPVVNHAGHVTGVIECINRRVGEFDEDDVQLLRAIASQISIALDNARLHADAVDTRNYLENVQRSIASGIVTLDENGQVVTTNRAAERMLPQLRRRTVVRDLRRLIGDANEQLCELIDGAYERRQPESSYELTLRRGESDRDISSVNVSVLPLNDAEGSFKGLVVVIEDITKEQRLKSAFSHYVSPAVIDQLVAEPTSVRLGGEKRELTVLFTDIEGFTTVSEGVDPGELVKALNEYFDEICSVVLPYGATIDKIVADSLHVMFNAPLDQPDHAERAVRCALELSERSREMMTRPSAGSITFGPTRVGVHTGVCVVGNFGGASRFDYTAHGDTMNTASRLEGANKYLGTRICVSGATRERCRDFAFRPLGELVMKGKRESLEAFEPLTAADAVEPSKAAYLEAYQLMASGDPSAADAFRRLAERYPEDRLIGLHANRLAAGAKGVKVYFTDK